ncbi:hypothetical protein GCM10011494_33080 [Novosphingobium endophyticum]|uniref:DNA adenine methylase n=1 Tax=Novosphingobium endophyticum TaxID=1955250 RepID=A0A916TXE5_9SPHN|nr:hypothetical protein [Novosphingobium endophyticum]GGC11671.1 hypothetical protein GCM10011494_33080 [Novosphingobium endophyticum]
MSADFAALAGQLAALKGRFLMSLNDNDGVRETFGAFNIATIERTYGVGKKPKAVSQVVISNFALPANDN